MLHPGRVVEYQSASSCCAGRCVVVRRTRSVDYAVSTFIGLSLTHLLDMDTTVALSIMRETSHHSWLTTH